MAQQRLAVTVIPGAGWRAGDIRTVAQEAEDAGFDAIFNTEVNSDTMTTAHVMGCATSRIRVGTWIANIYLRHSYVCAKGAGLIADDTNGRFTLGLGVSHQPVNTALGIDRPPPRDLHRYIVEVRDWLKGRGPTTHLPQQPAPVAVPLYVATLNLRATERAAEAADGVMPTMWSPERVQRSLIAIERGRSRTRNSDRSTSRSVSRRFSARTCTPSARSHAATSGSTRRSRTFSGCGGKAVSPPRPTPWQEGPAQPH
jgi:alkanesulfonate monooxygenase SsuD/methylene tetrahydromethanopterin reductase-like flavin-dependent oxidoreductase (luciferase family)